MPEPATSYRFSFGPWTLSEGADSFGPDVRHGGKAEDPEILRRTEQLFGQGTAGIVHGWNVIHHALMVIVHQGATAEEVRRFPSPKGG